MHFAGEIFNRKIEKISNFLSEVFEDSARMQGKSSALLAFFDRHPAFLKEAFHRFCENLMTCILSYESDPCGNPGSFSRDLSVWGDFSDFTELDCQAAILRQMDGMRRKELEDLRWKLESCKLFMDEKTERFFEMSNVGQFLAGRASEGDKENRAFNGTQELERSRLMGKIACLEERLRMKEAEMRRERMERERVLSIEEEAIRTQSLANTHRSREIRNREKQLGERELMVLMQSKHCHVPSKSFSNNLY